MGHLIPIGDIHLGDRAFSKYGRKKLLGYLDWVKETPGARIFIVGDVFNAASRLSKTSPLEEDTSEYSMAAALLTPYKDKIIGAIDGNHEARVLDMFGFSPLQFVCAKIGIQYCEWSAVVHFKVGQREVSGRKVWNQHYHGYFHHTTGGGATIGGKINRVTKLREIAEGIDFYCGGHNHQLAAAPQDVYYPSIDAGDMKKRRIWYIDCGSFLEWNNSYAEKGMMAPTKLGAPRIDLDGRHSRDEKKDYHDVHVSI